jgi:hypothetical protein
MLEYWKYLCQEIILGNSCIIILVMVWLVVQNPRALPATGQDSQCARQEWVCSPQIRTVQNRS